MDCGRLMPKDFYDTFDFNEDRPVACSGAATAASIYLASSKATS